MAIVSYEEIFFGSTQITVGVTDDVPPLKILLTGDGSGSVAPTGSALKPVTFTLDTNVYAANDVLSDTMVITDFFTVEDGIADVYSIKLHDKDDQTPYDIRVYFMDSNVSLGTKNSAMSISDTDAAHILTIVEISAADAIDVINGRIYVAKFSPRTVRAATGTKNLYVALQVGATGTPTHTASGIVGEFGGG